MKGMSQGKEAKLGVKGIAYRKARAKVVAVQLE